MGVSQEHAVRFYVDERDLADRVAQFVASGFAAGSPAVVVATPQHVELFKAALADRGCNSDRIDQEWKLVVADAQATLDRIVVDELPSARVFSDAVGSLLDDAEAGTTQAPVVYGEMVDLAHRAGKTETAIRLEELWNELGNRRTFSLLCAYRIDIFDRNALTTTIPDVCRVHARVDVSQDTERLSIAVALAMAEVLGTQKADDVYYIVGNRSGPERVPLAQRALMWVSGYSPELADRVLHHARALYDGDIEPAHTSYKPLPASRVRTAY